MVWKISGICTVEDVPVAGITVYALKQPGLTLAGQATSAADGKYEISGLESGAKYHVISTFEASGVKYNALSLWDVQPYEV